MENTFISINPLCFGDTYIDDKHEIVRWYEQEDKSWLYCDCPLDNDYSHIGLGLDYLTGMPSNAPGKINYYLIRHGQNPIGFSIISHGFEYFKDLTGVSMGLDLPEAKARNRGFGTAAVKEMLYELKGKQDHIFLETLSYNWPMQKLAESVGFRLTDRMELGNEYQIGFRQHIEDIASCLNVPLEKLNCHKVEALLYKIDLTDWNYCI